MRSGRYKETLELTVDEKAQLDAIARSRSVPVALNQRAKIVIASAAGETSIVVAARLRTTR